MVPVHLNALLGLAAVSGFIFTIASFCFAGISMMPASQGFPIVLIAMASLGFTGTSIFFLNKKLGPVVYGFNLAASGYQIIAALAVASLVGEDAKSQGPNSSTLRAVVAGAALVLIFHSAILAGLLYFRSILVSSDVPASGYGGQASTYQPSTYANTYGQDQGGYQAESQNL